ncbi:uncharacterized protein [Ptychodera flava]|uniref:uncharacterized protein isoform X1 n=1 Tax=Ptychodera flava TaxID=63121 RepID=UPI00396A36EE
MSAKITKRQLFNGHSSPTKTTPEKPVKKKHALGVIKTSKKCQWTVDEEKALVEYISLSKLEHEFSEWPYMKASSPFWIEAAAEVNKVGLKGRTGSACRQRTVEGENSLKARFGTLEKAEMKFGILQVDLDLDHIGTTTTQSQSQSTLADGLQTPQILRVHNSDIPPLSLLTSPEVVNMLSPEVKSTVIEQVFSSMSASDQLSVLKSLVTSTEKKNLLPATEHSFQSLLLHRNVVYPPNDYVQLSTDVMLMLQSRNEDNIPYELLKAIGLKRDDGSPRMPLDRMPYPMICYAIKFFNSSAPSQVKCPEIYLQWLDTMYANFGERFVQLYRGPCWSGVSNGDYHTQNAKVNIPSVSTRRLRVRAEENEFKADTSIQTSALQQLKQISPGTRVWIKADGTDMHPVLQESKRQLWHGDVDICDGNLAALYRDYNDRRNRLKSIVKTVNGNVGSLQRWHEDLQDDRVFLREGQKTAVAKFNKKQGDNNTPESTLMRLSWEVHEYAMLHQICDEYIDVCACYLQQINEDAQCSPNVIAAIRDELNEMLEYLRNLYREENSSLSCIGIHGS